MGPAETHEIVYECVWQKPHVPIGGHGHGAVAFAQPAAIAAKHHGYMTERRQGGLKSAVEQELLGGIHDVIVAANDRVDIHGNIVDDDDKIIRGGTVAAANNKVILFIVLENNITLDHIFDHGGTREGSFKSYYRIVGFF